MQSRWIRFRQGNGWERGKKAFVFSSELWQHWQENKALSGLGERQALCRGMQACREPRVKYPDELQRIANGQYDTNCQREEHMVTPEEMFGKRYEEGDLIFRQGDAGDTMYVIMSGEVEVSREKKRERVVLARMKRGEFFGEMSLMDDMPRSATVTALRRTRLLPITRRSLFERAEHDPAVLIQMLGALSTRILNATPLIHSLLKADKKLSRAWAESRGESSSAETPEEIPATTTAQPFPANIESDAVPAVPDEEGLLFPYDPTSCSWFEPGQTIFREGDGGEEMYFIVEGQVEITLEHEGETRRVALLGPQDFFGEMALITKQPRSANAVALAKTSLLPVCRDEFMSKIKSKPEFGLFILQVLVSRLRSTLARPAD